MSKKQQQPTTRIGGRDSGTGRFIPVEETRRRPENTQRERIPLPGHGDTGRTEKKKSSS